MPEPPLADHELRVVRGMIDQYQHDRQRSLIVQEFFNDTRTVAVAVCGTVLLAVNIVTLIVLIHSLK